MEEKTKVCGRCGKEKPLSEFYRAPANKDGHNNRCIDCLKQYRREYIERKKNGEPALYAARMSTVRKEKPVIESLEPSYKFWNELLLKQRGIKNACL